MSHSNLIPTWHKESYDRLLNQSLPDLLSSRLPLSGYITEPAGPDTLNIIIELSNGNGGIEAQFNIPQPDERGVFKIDGENLVVIPHVMDDDVSAADVLCVGERLYQHIDDKLGIAPENLSWDETLLHAWVQLDKWVADFFELYAQKLDQTNWLATQRHLRAVYLPDRDALITPGHKGRVCPFETPEGPNIARVLRIAAGAIIKENKIVILDNSPAADLGVTARMIPLLEHDDPNRILMGANMMGQWITPPDPEPALVQTGFEPDTPDFWCGRNLLTAFISWGGDTIEDGIVLSESCAARLGYPHPAEPGDKISNRHGSKGVISRIMPDNLMPHLPDGTPVELIYSFMGVPGRLNFGQIREALWGRIARVEGVPVITPPFGGPCVDELRRRMAKSGLPESGMEKLIITDELKGSLGITAGTLELKSTVGWVYWGKTVHTARNKLMGGAAASLNNARDIGLQRQAELEFRALRDACAFETVLETFNTRAAYDTEGLSEQVTSGPVEKARYPSPGFQEIQKRLKAAGIHMASEEESLSFYFDRSDGETLTLGKPVRHPWLWTHQLSEIGKTADIPEYHRVEETNARLVRMLESSAPASLVESTHHQLQDQVDEYFSRLLGPKDLRFNARVQFSGRALIAPGPEFRLDQIGLPVEMAWRLFSPLVVREIGDKDAVESRSPQAESSLDEIMSRSWIIINRAPSLSPTAIVAFQPVRIQENVIRFNPLVCPWLNADFDGDQVAVFLPITPEGQNEAAEVLSVAGHIKRDPDLIRSLSPTKAAIWGLARLSLTPEGKDELLGSLGCPMPNGYLTGVSLGNAMLDFLKTKGAEEAIKKLEQLAKRGFDVTRLSGASVSPFIGESINLLPQPENDDPGTWKVYFDQITDQIAARADFDEPDLGVHLLSIKTRKLKSPPQLFTILCAARGPISGIDKNPVVIKNSHVRGLTPDEMHTLVAGSREGLARIVKQWQQPEQVAVTGSGVQSFNVLARARRSANPGVVFARAAAIREVDPMVDLDSRLFVGLKPK